MGFEFFYDGENVDCGFFNGFVTTSQIQKTPIRLFTDPSAKCPVHKIDLFVPVEIHFLSVISETLFLRNRFAFYQGYSILE